MAPGRKLGTFALALAAFLGLGAVIGNVAGPIDTDDADSHSPHEAAEGADADATELPAAGLLVSQDGYTLEPEDRTLGSAPFAFTIIGPDGHPVVDYAELHDRELHLIVASRDLREYAHVHPVRDTDGRWTVALPALAPGAYRVFADFQPAGHTQLTLGVDASVPGAAATAEPLHPTASDSGDGLEVTLTESDDGAELTVTVRRDGQVVTTEPYLGAAGHLVALRDGDLAYLHVHPLDHEPSGPVSFAVEIPAAGTYALFFDFKVDGVVRTARFVLDTAGTSAGHGGH